MSFFLHELGHALGFNGRGDGNTGIVSGQFMSTYDTLVATSGGFPVFTGANAVAAYGGPVPLSTGIVNSYVHYGRVTADGLDLGLMEGSTYAPSGVRWYVDVLDLAFFRDMGLTTVSSPIADAGGSRFQSFAGSDSLNGGIGADTFNTFDDAGTDRILDFSRAEGDRVRLDPGSIYTVSQVGSDTVVSVTGGAQLILVGVSQASLTGDWIFVG